MVSPDNQLQQQHIGEVDKRQDSETSRLGDAKVADASLSKIQTQEDMKDLTAATSSKSISSPVNKDQLNLKTLYGVNVQNYKNKIGYQFSSAEKTVDEFLNQKSADLQGKARFRNDISKDLIDDFSLNTDESVLNGFEGLLNQSRFSVLPNFSRLMGNEARMSTLPKLSLTNKNGSFADYTAATRKDQAWPSCATSASTLKSPTFSMADISVVVPSFVELSDSSRDDAGSEDDVQSLEGTSTNGATNNGSTDSSMNTEDNPICKQVEKLERHNSEALADLSSSQPSHNSVSSNQQPSHDESVSSSHIEILATNPCRLVDEETTATSPNNTTISSIDYREECNHEITCERRSISGRSRSASPTSESNNNATNGILPSEEKSTEDATGSTESISSFDFPDENDFDEFENSKVEAEWQYVGANRSKQKRKQNRAQASTKRAERPQKRSTKPTSCINKETDRPANSKPSYMPPRTIPNRFLRAKAKQQNTSAAYSPCYKDNKSPASHPSVPRDSDSTAVIWSKSVIQTRTSVKGELRNLGSNPEAPAPLPATSFQLNSSSFKASSTAQLNGTEKAMLPDQAAMELNQQASGVPVEANGPALSTASIEQGLKSILLGSNAVTDVKPQLEGAELLRHLRHQLEYYFSNENLAQDSYLRSQMDSEQWVPIWTIANFNAVKKLTSDVGMVVQALKSSLMVEVDASDEKVRPNQNLWAVLIREVPDDADEKEILGLFDGASAKATSCTYAGNNNWYVIFQNETDVQTAYRHLREVVCTFRDQPIRARIKSKLHRLNSLTNPNTTSAAAVANSTLQVTSPMDYFPPQHLVICPPQMAAGPGPLPGQISASVPPFVPRVAAAPNPVGNSTQPSGSAMAIAPPLGGFVVPQPWQASLYPDPSMARPQIAGTFLPPTFKPPAVPQYQLHSTVANKPNTTTNQRYSVVPEPQEGVAQPKATTAPAVPPNQPQAQPLSIGVAAPPATQSQPYYILTEPHPTPDMIQYMPAENASVYRPASVPNAPYLPAVNGAPFVMPNANEASIMVAAPPPLPQNMHFRNGKRPDQVMQPLVQPVYFAPEQNHPSAPNQRGRYPSRSSSSGYQSDANSRFMNKENPNYPPLNNYNGPPYPVRSLSREHPYGNKSSNAYSANDKRGRNSPALPPTPSEAYPQTEQARTQAVGSDYPNLPSGDQHHMKRNNYARRTASGSSHTAPVHNEQRTSYQAGYDRRNMRQRRPRRPEDEMHMTYGLPNTTFHLESNSFPPLPGASEPSLVSQAPENRLSADEKGIESAKHQKEIARPSLPAKKYSEVSNAHVSNKSIPMQPKQIQRPETNKAREYTAASAVNTQLVSDKSPPVVAKQPRQQLAVSVPLNEVVEQGTHVNGPEQISSPSVRKIVPEQNAILPNGTLRSDSRPNDAGSPTNLDAPEKMKSELEQDEDDTELETKLTYAQKLKMVKADSSAAQTNGKDSSDSGGEIRPGVEPKPVDLESVENDRKPEMDRCNDEDAPAKYERRGDGRRYGNHDSRRGGSWQPRHSLDRNDDFRRYPRRDWGYERGNGPREFRGHGGFRGRRVFRDNRPQNIRSLPNGQVAPVNR